MKIQKKVSSSPIEKSFYYFLIKDSIIVLENFIQGIIIIIFYFER